MVRMSRSDRGLEFCCCAIPLINFGSYTICLEFIFVALCVALLAIGPPSIVASTGSLPSGWPKAIVCVLGFIIVAWQILGIISIKREKIGLYRTYIRINFLLTLITILVTLAFFAVSAARHSTALASCVALYGNTPAGSSTTELEGVGTTICNIFIWVQVGFMGLLIALIGLTQLYMCYCQKVYGQEMRRADRDHKTYSGNTEGIPLANRGSGIWEGADGPTTATLPIKQEQQQRAYANDYNNGAPGSVGSNSSHEQLPVGGQANYGETAPAAYSYPRYDTGAAPLSDSYDTSYHQSYDSQHYGGYQSHESQGQAYPQHQYRY